MKQIDEVWNEKGNKKEKKKWSQVFPKPKTSA